MFQRGYVKQTPQLLVTIYLSLNVVLAVGSSPSISMAKSVETVALPIAYAMGGHHHPVQMSMTFSVGKHLSLQLDSQQIYIHRLYQCWVCARRCLRTRGNCIHLVVYIRIRTLRNNLNYVDTIQAHGVRQCIHVHRWLCRPLLNL